MSERKINLEEIIFKDHSKMIEFKKDFPKTHQVYMDAMLEFGKQLLELAAENADIHYSEENPTWFDSDSSCWRELNNPGQCWVRTDKQSILDTIKQVE